MRDSHAAGKRSTDKIAAFAWLALILMQRSAIAVEPQVVAEGAKSKIIFTDVTAETGIDFVHTDGSDGRHFMIESMSAGLALLDFDNDGDLDIYFLNGAPIANPDLPAPPNALYRNDGGFRFTDVTESAGVGDIGFGLGVACADFDNDGYVDLFTNNYGGNRLYRNNGDGTFCDATGRGALGGGKRVGGGTSFFDMDMDGDLDLYVANYIQFDEENHELHIHKGLPLYRSPLTYEPATDMLFRNEADGTFVDVSAESGISSVSGRSMGMLTFDYDQDGDFDIYVANDSQENHLFENDGSGNFTEVALLNGWAYDLHAKAQASMGVGAADFDRDGLTDLVVTSFAEEFTTVYHNAGFGFADDLTLKSGISRSTFAHVTWGVVTEDFDLDGWPDLMIGAGHVDDNFDRRVGNGRSTGYKPPNLLYRNRGQGRFEYLDRRWGSAAKVSEATRGLIAGDLDGDGDADVIALNSRGQPTVMRNDSSPASHVKFRLMGTHSNRDGIGAEIQLQRGDMKIATWVRSGQSYQSDARGPVVIGVDGPSREITVSVTWPGDDRPTEYQLDPGDTGAEIIRQSEHDAQQDASKPQGS